MKRLLNLYSYALPPLLLPLGYWLWWRLCGDHRFVAIVLSMPILFAYIVPGLGTNWLGLWEFDTRWKLGRFRPHHGFVFGSATGILTLVCVDPRWPPFSGWELARTALVVGSFLAFWNWAYDILAIRRDCSSSTTAPTAGTRGPKPSPPTTPRSSSGPSGPATAVRSACASMCCSSKVGGSVFGGWQSPATSWCWFCPSSCSSFFTTCGPARPVFDPAAGREIRDENEAHADLSLRRPQAEHPYVRSWQMQPLSMAVLAGLMPPEFEVRFYDDRLEEIPFDEPTDLVAISVETFTALRAYKIARQFRVRGVPVVLGGYHVTLDPRGSSPWRPMPSWLATRSRSGSSSSTTPGTVDCCSRSTTARALDSLAGLRPRRDLFPGKPLSTHHARGVRAGLLFPLRFLLDHRLPWGKTVRSSAPRCGAAEMEATGSRCVLHRGRQPRPASPPGCEIFAKS